jgi:type IV secretion system protein VirD4
MEPINVMPLIVMAAVMFAVIGGITLFSHWYSLNRIKSKTVGDGQHGTARWALKREIRDMYQTVPFEPKLWRQGKNLPPVEPDK